MTARSPKEDPNVSLNTTDNTILDFDESEFADYDDDVELLGLKHVKTPTTTPVNLKRGQIELEAKEEKSSPSSSTQGFIFQRSSQPDFSIMNAVVSYHPKDANLVKHAILPQFPHVTFREEILEKIAEESLAEFRFCFISNAYVAAVPSNGMSVILESAEKEMLFIFKLDDELESEEWNELLQKPDSLLRLFRSFHT